MKETSRANQVVYIVSLIILSAGLLQLASKAVLITTIGIVLLGFPLLLDERVRKIKFVGGALIITFITLINVTQISSFKKRYVSEFKDDLSDISMSNTIPEPRVVRWKSALALVDKSFIIGYGSGSERNLLKERYFEDKLFNSYLHELNAHNQYLSFLLKNGIIGLAIFLLTLYMGFVSAWRTRNIVFISFLLLISIVSFSENILDVNKGIFFYAFFFTFFIKTGNDFKSQPAA
ncbi:MAG: O-antigen ligase family protein [Chitinophagaceae bacterium]